MRYRIETDREEDGRWIAEIPELPGVMVYAGTEPGAIVRVKALAMHVLADRIEREGDGEAFPLSFVSG